ncbi:MAG: sigma-70 family RNA polymerase sigma factor [Bacteroidia bacterium]|nr:sigma-70 family RNA polymerase sigma factor [Bacteroidia bacterium]
MQTTDKILLKAIENKDRKAFSQFYKRYSRPVLCFVLSKVHNKEIAKDIIQNFWLSFWENPSILRANEDGCVKVFMLQYLRFRIYDTYRIAVPETILAEDIDIVSPLTSHENIEKEELLQIVRDALKNSSILTQNTFWMRVENVSAKEVANELNTTSQTVHNAFSKSLGTIRDYLKKHYPEISKSGIRLFTLIVSVTIYFFR